MAEFYTNVCRYRNEILYRGYSHDGKQIKRPVKFKPTLYTPHKQGNAKSIFGQPVIPTQYDSMSDATAFLKRNEDISGFDVYGTTDYVAQYVQERWPGEVLYQEDLIRVMNIDIEVLSDQGFPEPDDALWPIDLITMKCSGRDNYVVLSLYDWKAEKSEVDPEILDKVEHQQFDDERDLLEAFITIWNAYAPDVITGWNVQGFDVIYLYNRISRLLGESRAKLLSPWQKSEKRSIQMRFGKEKTVVDLLGIAQIDFMEVFRKFGAKYGPQENYKLDTICNTVLKTGKLSYEEYASLHDLAKNNPQKYTDYNIIDVYRVEQLIEKTGLMSLVFTMVYRAGAQYMDAFGTTRIWDTIIYRDLMQRNIVVQQPKHSPSTKYEGAYVKEIESSNYTYLASFDVSSLYPNIMIEWNMSPETLMPGMMDVAPDTFLRNPQKLTPSGDYAVAANGACFRKDKQGCIPRILEEYYADRKKIQAEMFKAEEDREAMKQAGVKDLDDIDNRIARLFNEQQAIKILINSVYGAMGNAFFRHYDLRIAEGVTLTGQLIIQWAEKCINKYMSEIVGVEADYVCYVDTDSNYINMAPLIEKFKPSDPIQFIDDVCKEGISLALKNAFNSLSNKLNTFKPRIEMGREVIADRGLWTSKKRYALRLQMKENVRFSEPKLKIMGLEAVKSSTPTVVRGWMAEYIKLVLNDKEDEAEDFLNAKREEFVKLSPEEIAMPRTANINKWKLGDKGIPFHIRGALSYNQLLTDTGLDKNYAPVYNGDKIKYLYLIKPNPIQQNVIAFPDMMPREGNLLDYIDYETQFQKCFVDPLQPLKDAMGWHASDESSLSILWS